MLICEAWIPNTTMDHMEFSIALPPYMDFTSAGQEWTSMKQRLNAHVNHSADLHYQHIQGVVKAFLINIAAEQVQEVFNMFGLSYDEAVKFNRVLQRLEDVCLPRFLIIYNRFKFFTSKQADNGKFNEFLRDLLSWSENCEFGDLRDILVKDCIITGISDDSVRQDLLKTEELDLLKTVEICKSVEQQKRMKNAQVSTDQTLCLDACVGTDHSESASSGMCIDTGDLQSSSIEEVKKEFKKQFCDASTNTKVEYAVSEVASFHCLETMVDDSLPVISVGDQFEDSVILSELQTCSEMLNGGKRGKEKESVSDVEVAMAEDIELERKSPRKLRRSKRNMKKTQLKRTKKLRIKKETSEEREDETANSKKLELALRTLIQEIKSENTEAVLVKKEEEVLCSSCGQSFPSYESILPHLEEVHGKTRSRRFSLKCKVCKQVFMDVAGLRKHRLTHKGERRFKCEMCAAMFGNPSHLKVHMRLHTGERPYTCDTCGASYPEASKLKAHIRKHTGEKPYQCGLCPRTFAWTAAYTRHMRTHTGERPYTCEYCGGGFADFTSLQRHRRTHTKERPYECDVCEAKFTDPSGLKLHRRGHTGERPFSCGTCGAAFVRSQHLKEHMKLHTGEKPFECETCGAKFVEASKLKSHRRKHTGEKPYLCKICGASFAWTAAYTRHMRTHTLEKPYVCDYCGSHFADHSTLTRHRRTHTGERPYPCGLCSSSFADNSSLHRHMRTHTGEKSYTCEVCGSSFAVKSYLIRHMRTHTGEKPYACDLCESKFTDSSKLKRHRKIHLKMRIKQERQEKQREPQQHYEQLQPVSQLMPQEDQPQLQPLAEDGDSEEVMTGSQPLALGQDSHQHPLLVTSNLLPLTNVLPFTSEIMS